MKERIPPSVVESYGEGRRRLLDLEKTGKYLFHGTRVAGLNELLPSLPFTYVQENRIPHGDRPTISATPSADMAIFYAVVVGGYRGVSTNGKEVTYSATKKALDYAKTHTGYVYVVDRNDFNYPLGAHALIEVRADKPTHVLQAIPVGFTDIVEKIQELPPHPSES